MPNEVLNKIKYLCRAIPKVEWSGILLYAVEGSIKEPLKMKIILKDIILMNKGSQAYTEYNFNEKKRDQSGYVDRHIDYTNEHEEALEWHIGHIHSHNTMNVFFSGTDMDELHENSECHNFYLSLIVNNFMDFCCKVAFRGTASTKVDMPYIAMDENGNEYTIEEATFNVKKEKLFIYDCEIESKAEKIKVNSAFANNVTEVIEEADKPKPVHTTYPASSQQSSVVVNQPVAKTNITPQATIKKVEQKPSDIVRGFVDDIPFDELDTLFPKDEPEDIELFIMSLLTGGSIEEGCETLMDVLEYIAAFEDSISSDDVSKAVVDNYAPFYEKMFEEQSENPNFFRALTEDVIGMLEDYEGEYEFLSKAIMSIKYILKKFEEYEQQPTV